MNTSLTLWPYTTDCDVDCDVDLNKIKSRNYTYFVSVLSTPVMQRNRQN